MIFFDYQSRFIRGHVDCHQLTDLNREWTRMNTTTESRKDAPSPDVGPSNIGAKALADRLQIDTDGLFFASIPANSRLNLRPFPVSLL